MLTWGSFLNVFIHSVLTAMVPMKDNSFLWILSSFCDKLVLIADGMLRIVSKQASKSDPNAKLLLVLSH